MQYLIAQSENCGRRTECSTVDEFKIIARYFERKLQDDSVRIGIGDDGAVVRPDTQKDLITVVDSIVSGVHFPDWLSPVDIGYRAVATNLSDVAAMGGKPRWMTLALTLCELDPEWLKAFSSGLFLAAKEFNVALVGGDTTRGSEIVISVQILGHIEKGNALERKGARPGDGIYVSGTLGDASAGLSILQSGVPLNQVSDFLVRRFQRPKPRIDLGRFLLNRASAAIDLSDGFYADLEKLLIASQVGGFIELDDMPLSPQITQFMDRQDAMNFALAGGDDYELCFTAGDQFINETDVPVRRIGTITTDSGLM